MGRRVPEKGETTPGIRQCQGRNSAVFRNQRTKKAYGEVTQWQGKEMRNLSRCISAVIESAFRNPNSLQHHDFQNALKCVSTLVDFSLMGQYRRHTSDTLSYMEKYLAIFHRTKDVFLEFRTWKATRTEANRQDREVRELIAK